jgi:dihydroneopterin aldolase
MDDRIEIRDLRLVGTHGVLPEERERPQPFSVDLDVWLDAGRAEVTDDLAETADYAAIVEQAAHVVETGHFALLEALTSAVAEAVLAGDRRIVEVEATVRKTRPPLPRDVGSVGVRVVRRRGGGD